MREGMHIHFIGIGGSGMNGIARIMLELGYKVTGSDLNTGKTTARLTDLGAVCYKGHAPENINGAEMVVVSTAIAANNVELAAAKEQGLPVRHRGEMLALLMDRQKGVAIAGSHGKTSTTAMLSLVAEKNRLDPTIIIGGELSDIDGNAKLGRGVYLIAEADESDGSFLKLEPFIEIITNIEDDHLDYYKSTANIIAAFKSFIGKVPRDGALIACLDCENTARILQAYEGNRITYAVNRSDADYSLGNIRLDQDKTGGDVYFRGEKLGSLTLRAPGLHNLSNALAVVAAGRFMGLSFTGIKEALSEFKGAGRRFQYLGKVGGVSVVDDYAHHPSEIVATLKAARQVNEGRVISVFQPHRYTRANRFKERFGESFSDADVIIVSDIYSAGEAPIDGVNAGSIKTAIERHEGREVFYLPTRTEIVDYLTKNARPGDLILTIGAGDIWRAGVELVNRLKES